MGGGNSGMQGQWVDKQGILHPAWAFGKELLLPKVPFVFHWESIIQRKTLRKLL